MLSASFSSEAGEMTNTPQSPRCVPEERLLVNQKLQETDEPLLRVRVACGFRREERERYGAFEAGILGFVDDAHWVTAVHPASIRTENMVALRTSGNRRLAGHSGSIRVADRRDPYLDRNPAAINQGEENRNAYDYRFWRTV